MNSSLRLKLLLQNSSLLIILCVFLISCESAQVVETEVKTEEFPEINRKEFQKIQIDEGLETILPKNLSLTSEGRGSLLCSYSELSNEEHISFYKHTVDWFSDGLVARKIKNENTLQLFASHQLEELCGTFKGCSDYKLEESVVNGLKCFRTEFKARSYGFPKQKHYFIRYYQNKKNFFSIISWTVEGDEKSFEKKMKATALSLKPQA